MPPERHLLGFTLPLLRCPASWYHALRGLCSITVLGTAVPRLGPPASPAPADFASLAFPLRL